MKTLLGFHAITWDELLEIVENTLQNRGYKRFSQRLGREDFTYWKSFEGYQIGIKFYDFRKYIAHEPEADSISVMFTIVPLRDDGRVELEISIPLTVEKVESLAEEFFSFTQKYLICTS